MNKWFFGILTLAFSCQQKQECNLAETIFAKPDTAHCVIWELEDLINLPVHYDTIRGGMIAKPADYIKLGNKYLLVSINWNSDFPIFGCWKQRNVIEIKCNGEHLLINDEVQDLNSLDSFYANAYLNNGIKPKLPRATSMCLFNFNMENANPLIFEKALKDLTIFYTSILTNAMENSEDKCITYIQDYNKLKKMYPLKVNIELPNRISKFGQILLPIAPVNN